MSPNREAEIGSSPLERITSHENSKYRQIARSVGLLEVLFRRNNSTEVRYFCTATLIDNNHILTNAHCFKDKENGGQVVDAMLHMGYDGFIQDSQAYKVDITPRESDAYFDGKSDTHLDYAILFVYGSPGQEWGHITWNVRSPRPGERVFIIQHPKGGVKKISQCSIYPNTSSTSYVFRHRFRHGCSTLFGSSGSVVISEETNELLALHFGYFDFEVGEYNSATSLGQIQRQSPFIQRNILPTVRTVEELISRAQQGGILKLAATTFHLNSTLELAGDVQLIGQGKWQTRIVSDAANYIMHYRGGGTLSMEGIGIEHIGSNEASILKVDDGTLEIDNCHFFGANRGSGLVIAGNTWGTVKNSLFVNNGLHGISVNDNAQPSIESNSLYDNKQDGIAYAGSAGGNAINNECYNSTNGISVSDKAQPNIDGNRLHDNYIGIAYFHESGGLIRGNEIYSNVYGIYVARSAQPSRTFNDENVISGNIRMDVVDER